MLFGVLNLFIGFSALALLVYLLCRRTQNKLEEFGLKEISPRQGINCPILERTGDGYRAGRCWYWSPNYICPRHGDIYLAAQLYKTEKILTDENDLNDKKN